MSFRAKAPTNIRDVSQLNGRTEDTGFPCLLRISWRKLRTRIGTNPKNDRNENVMRAIQSEDKDSGWEDIDLGKGGVCNSEIGMLRDKGTKISLENTSRHEGLKPVALPQLTYKVVFSILVDWSEVYDIAARKIMFRWTCGVYSDAFSAALSGAASSQPFPPIAFSMMWTSLLRHCVLPHSRYMLFKGRVWRTCCPHPGSAPFEKRRPVIVEESCG